MSVSEARATSPWQPWTGGRFLEVGSRAAALALVLYAAYARLEGVSATFWLVLLAATSLTVPLVLRLRTGDGLDRVSPWWSYVWVLGGLALMTVLVLLAVDPPVETWTPLWALVAVNAGFSLPRRGQAIVHGVAVVTLAIVLVDAAAPSSSLVMHLGLYAVLAWLVDCVGQQLRTELASARAGREAAERAASLLETMAGMNTLDLEDVADAAVDGLRELGYAMAAFAYVDRDDEMLHTMAAKGFASVRQIQAPMPTDEGLAGHAIRRRETVVLPDYQVWEGAIPDRPEIRGCVAVPVIVDGAVRAVLLAASHDVGGPDEDQRALIELVAAQASRVIRSTDRFERERELAERLRELDALKKDFVASVSHELRTPMTLISGIGETLAERGVEPALRRTLLERLDANADRLDGLIATLLQLSRLEAGAIDLRREPIPLRESVDAAVDDVVDQLREHVLVVEVGEEDVVADRGLLEHVLGVLLGNAAKHTPAGTTVTIRSRTCPSGVRVVVEDDGPGISEREQRQVADHFFRGGHALRRESSGLGLGLSIASAILAQHDTRLEVGRSPSGGASFGFVLACPGEGGGTLGR